MPIVDVAIAVVIVPSALVVLCWAYYILKKSASREVSFRAATALGFFIVAAKSIAMAIGVSDPRPSWALALCMLCTASWIVRVLMKSHGRNPGPTAWDQL